MFMFKEDLKKHQLQHDDVSEYRCSHCGRRMKNEEHLLAHVKEHFLNEKFGCNVCEARFRMKKHLEKHLIHVHFICQYCGGTSNDIKELKKHLKIHDDLKCLFCQKVFSQKNRLKYHYQLSHGHQDFYQCSLCYQTFGKRSTLLDHLRLKHNGKSNFVCKICAIPFLYWQHYKNHFESMHLKKVVNKFDCSFCEYSSNAKFKLKCHVEKSSGIGFFCKKCQLRLECKGRFDKHMKSHDEESLWTCDYCPKTCRSDNVLRYHIQRSHQHQAKPIKPQVYPCLKKECIRYYVTKSSLARHMRRAHSDPKNSTCTFIQPKTVPADETPSNISGNIGEEQEACKDSEEDIINEECNGSIQSRSNTCDEEKLESVKQSNEKSDEKGYHHMVKPLSSTVEVNVFYCGTCQKFWFTGKVQFRKHMKTHVKNVWEEKCDDCNIDLETPEEAVKHYAEQHLKVEYVQ